MLSERGPWIEMVEVNPPRLPSMTHLKLRGRWRDVLITDNPFKQVRVSPYAFAARKPGGWIRNALMDLLHAVQEQRNHVMEYRMVAADGRVVWLRDIVTAIVEQEQTVRLRGVMIDIPSEKQAQADQQQGP